MSDRSDIERIIAEEYHYWRKCADKDQERLADMGMGAMSALANVLSKVLREDSDRKSKAACMEANPARKLAEILEHLGHQVDVETLEEIAEYIEWDKTLFTEIDYTDPKTWPPDYQRCLLVGYRRQFMSGESPQEIMIFFNQRQFGAILKTTDHAWTHWRPLIPGLDFPINEKDSD